MDQNFMKERPIFPLVTAMSLPMVLSMLVNALYNIVDSYFVAKISDDGSLLGISRSKRGHGGGSGIWDRDQRGVGIFYGSGG